jgi:hypothetical protein
MMKLLKQVHTKVSERRGAHSIVLAFPRTRRALMSLLIIACALEFILYCLFLGYSIHTAAERTAYGERAVELHADLSEYEAMYLALRGNIDHDRAIELGFVEGTPVFVSREAVTRSLSFGNGI